MAEMRLMTAVRSSARNRRACVQPGRDRSCGATATAASPRRSTSIRAGSSSGVARTSTHARPASRVRSDLIDITYGRPLDSTDERLGTTLARQPLDNFLQLLGQLAKLRDHVRPRAGTLQLLRGLLLLGAVLELLWVVSLLAVLAVLGVLGILGILRVLTDLCVLGDLRVVGHDALVVGVRPVPLHQHALHASVAALADIA